MVRILFLQKNFGYLFAHKKCTYKLIKFMMIMAISKVTSNKEQYDLNKYSFLGLLNSILGKKSLYRIEN